MTFDLSDRFQLEKFQCRMQFLRERGALVELTEKKRGTDERRTLQQNRYLHVILGYFGKETGYTRDYVKTVFFKQAWNADIFETKVQDAVLGHEVTFLRSTRDLTKAELQLAIERFRNMSSMEVGIYIPSAEERSLVSAMEDEVRQYEQYL